MIREKMAECGVEIQGEGLKISGCPDGSALEGMRPVRPGNGGCDAVYSGQENLMRSWRMG